MNNRLEIALSEKLWVNHKIGDMYIMKGDSDLWKITYYPLFEDFKSKKEYNEPRALVEKPIKNGIDFREIPLRYLSKVNNL